MKSHWLLALFVVSWQATWSEPTTCSCAEPVLNEYTGRMETPKSVCASICYKTVNKPRKKTFQTLDAAKAFIAKGVQCGTAGNPFPNPCCSNFEIDVVDGGFIEWENKP